MMLKRYRVSTVDDGAIGGGRSPIDGGGRIVWATSAIMAYRIARALGL